MIYTESLTINGTEFVRTYSDTYKIEREGVEYDDAIDPIDSGRTYVESSTLLPELTAEEALNIILGGML